MIDMPISYKLSYFVISLVQLKILIGRKHV